MNDYITCTLVTGVAEENSNVKIGAEVSDMIENQDNLNDHDIVVVEDISERKIIVESTASSTVYGGDTEDEEEIQETKMVAERAFTVRSRASVLEEASEGESDKPDKPDKLTPKPPASAVSKASSRVPSGAPSKAPSKAPSVVVEPPKGEVNAVIAAPTARPPRGLGAPPVAPPPVPVPQKVELSIGAEPVKVPVVKEKESIERSKLLVCVYGCSTYCSDALILKGYGALFDALCTVK